MCQLSAGDNLMAMNPNDPPTSNSSVGWAAARPVIVILRLIGAIGAVVVVFVCMDWFKVPWPARAYIGILISLPMVVAISFEDLLTIGHVHLLIGTTAIVGAKTVCACTCAHFFLAPPVAVCALGVFELTRLGVVYVYTRANGDGNNPKTRG